MQTLLAAQGLGPSVLQLKSEGLSFSISQMDSFSVIVNFSCFLEGFCLVLFFTSLLHSFQVSTVK